MALVREGMPCALCGEPLDRSDCFATTHSLDSEHPLQAYSDAALHWECFDSHLSTPSSGGDAIAVSLPCAMRALTPGQLFEILRSPTRCGAPANVRPS